LSQVTAAELKQQVFARHQATSKKGKSTPKSTTIAAYAGVFLLIISMVAIGYQPPQKVDSVANAIESPTTTVTQPSVDQLVATSVAAGIAERADLSIAPNVANLSVSLSAESQLSQSDSDIVSKPQIIQPSADSRTIKHYVTVAGDTTTSVGQKFGISSNTVKWTNGLSTDAIEVGKDLLIPPVDGIVYTVKAGDTIDSIASKYKSDKDSIIAFNDLELGGLVVGKQVIVPSADVPENERPGYVAPSSGGGSGSGYTVSTALVQASAGNRYAYGNCTYYAYERRAALGRPIGSFWGNASSWAFSGAAAGFTVDHNPEVGAVAQWDAYQGGSYGAGHVGIVESVNSDGSITISEMNYLFNFNRVTYRTLDPSAVSHFIH
jgi:surface antigen